jgi:superfamily II DNA/RNA helicase
VVSILVAGSDITGLEQTGSQNTSEFLLPIIQAAASLGPSNDEGEMW